MNRTELLLSLASAFDGVSIDEAMAGLDVSSYKATQNHLSRMFIAKQLFRAVRFRSTRYFATQAAAEAYEARHPLTNEQKRKRKGAKQILAYKVWPLSLPGTPGRAQKTEAAVIVPEGVKRTVCPDWTHDPRYTVAPGVQPFGAGFAAAGVGRYLEA
jgi:hypothetical protein